MSDPILRIKNITDIEDKLKRADVMRNLLAHIESTQIAFLSAYSARRDKMVAINALYRNSSWVNEQKNNWQTKAFIPLTYNAVERKTSVIHEALWGNRFGSPFTALGKTAEDQAYAFSAETILNNTLDTIGFYDTSEECLRSVCKYGIGCYRYGWEVINDEYVWREPIINDKGEVKRKDDGSAILRYFKKMVKISRPFVRSIDVIDNLGFDPTAKSFDKWKCDFVYELREESKEEAWKKEERGEYIKGSFAGLDDVDPHGLAAFGLDDKRIQLAVDDGVQESITQTRPRFGVKDWYGWFDIDDDGKKEFIKVIVRENKQILQAVENLSGQYPFVDIQYTRSIHTLTPWGVVDPVLSLQHIINEMTNQRGDAIKLKLNPQFMINIDMILEDHAYISQPGAMHPFAAGADGDIRKAMNVLTFDNPEFISFQEQNLMTSEFDKATGVSDFSEALSGTSRTPASTTISLLNEQQTGNSMIINGVLNRHGVLGKRILILIQLYGDEKFVLRSAGRRGLEFRQENIENILGDFDIKVTTSSFFGNKQIELQHLIQLKPLWAQSPHIDQIELDKAILENIMPKRVDNIINIPEDPLSAIEEQAFFVINQGESVSISPLEGLADIQIKLQSYEGFVDTKATKNMDARNERLVKEHVQRLEVRLQELEQEQALKAQAAAQAQPEVEGEEVDGNVENTGDPAVRQLGNSVAPKVNNIEL